jgi:hypothetical protein
MLDRTTSQTTAAGQEPGRIKTAPRPIDHRRVKRKRFGVVNPTFAALAAFQVHTGEVSIGHLPIRDAARLLGVPERDLHLIRLASPAVIAALKAGNVTIEGLRALRRRPSRQAIRSFITKAGPDQVLDELDHLTAPASVVAAE